MLFQILLAVDLALDCKDTQADLWNRICKDEYMAYAVQECYYSVEKILHSLVDGEGRLWYEWLFYECGFCIPCFGGVQLFICFFYFVLCFLYLIGLKGSFVRSTTVYRRDHLSLLYVLRSFLMCCQDLLHCLDFWYVFLDYTCCFYSELILLVFEYSFK